MLRRFKRVELKIYSPDLLEKIDLLARQRGLDRTKLITEVIKRVTATPEIMYKCCPSCSQALFDESAISIKTKFLETKCLQGHEHVFDLEEGRFLK